MADKKMPGLIMIKDMKNKIYFSYKIGNLLKIDNNQRWQGCSNRNSHLAIGP